jgi:predicted NBD/HSP70 family sugar kinase
MRRETVARPDAIRRHNLGLLLGHVHRDGELTRAQLTQRLALSRSTIGVLVADLTDSGLLDERVPSGGLRAGRPSHVVAPRADGPYAIAVDVDVTRIVFAAVGIGGQVLARHEVNTSTNPSTPQQVAAYIADATCALGEQVSADAWPIGIGVSVPGTVGRVDGVVEFAPNLGWRNEPFGSELAAVAPDELPIAVGNDADLAMRAEHLRGAARDCDDAVFLMGRIGVGAGVIVNGAPLHGRDGHAGEVGHNVVDPSGPRCHCGKRGCVETYIGDKALLKLAGRRRAPTVETMSELFADARSGDERVADAVRTVARSLGHTVASLINVLNSERVILGGSLAGVYGFAHEEVARAMDEYAMSTAHDAVLLCTPGLNADSSLLGAAELAFAQLLVDPLAGRRPAPAVAQERV